MTALYVILGVLIALAITYLILTAPRSRNRRAGMEKLRVDYAHRGLWGGDIPENSIPAFSAAASAGYGVELDVQLSADRQVVVFHDYTLSRMCGEDTRVDSLGGAALTWRRLGKTDYTIPLLDDALTTVKGRVPVLIELKGKNSSTELCGPSQNTRALRRQGLCSPSTRICSAGSRRTCPGSPAACSTPISKKHFG